jgi:dTDP-4-dehydrorhamnose 3,5-epimerase
MNRPHIQNTSLDGLRLFYPHSISDDRGWFVKTYDKGFLKKNRWDFIPKEQYIHKTKAGVIRGLDFSISKEDSKMIFVVEGEGEAVFVDLRLDSSTLGKYEKILLSSNDKKLVLVPNGFATSIFALEDTIMCNQNSMLYDPKLDFKINPYDQDLSIQWPEHEASPPPTNGYISFEDATTKLKNLEYN